MPHVVLSGEISPAEVFDSLEPLMFREGGTVLKTSAKFLEAGGASVLVECLAIEDGKKSAFFALMGRRDDGLVVRLHPVTDPEKTDGVKRVLAMLANQVMEKHQGLSVGKTNLQEFL